MKTSNLDRLQSHELNSVALGNAVALGESMHAMGIYHAVNTIPVAHLRSEYAGLRDALELATVAHDFPLMDKLQASLTAIPQEIMWKAVAPNLVVTAGKNDLLDKYLAGSGYTAAWYMMLVSSAGYSAIAAADTAASHAGWTEATGYSNATRPTAAWNAAAAATKALSTGLVFNINAPATIKGCGLITNNTKGGTTGILLSAGLFTAGDQPVVDTNTLTVTYSLSV